MNTHRESRSKLVSWTVGVVGLLLVCVSPVLAQGKPQPNDPVVLLIKGPWTPIGTQPNIPGIVLPPDIYVENTLYRVTSIPNVNNQDQGVIGHVFLGANSGAIAYDLPGGAMAMEFTGGGWDQSPISDGHGGLYYQETWELTIGQATGIYSPYLKGHNHMVDRFDALTGGTSGLFAAPNFLPDIEFCYCIISVGGGNPLWWTSNVAD